jgi:hypothetical protein
LDAKEKRAMVPGMTERERLATDTRLWEWLAAATVGPTLTSVSPVAPVAASAQRSRLFSRLARDGLATARIIGSRVGLIQPLLTGAPSALPSGSAIAGGEVHFDPARME